MKKLIIVVTLFLLIPISIYCQTGLVEVSYTKPFLDSKNLGEMTAPNIFELGFGWAGNGGLIPNGAVTLGYIAMDDKTDNSLPNKSSYQSLMIGGKIGFRPFANIWVTRFQPIIQFGGKTTFKTTTKNETTNETEQLFSNGNTNVYEPTKITFLTGSLGFEYFIGQRFSVNVLGNYDYVTIEKSMFNNYSATVALRHYF